VGHTITPTPTPTYVPNTAPLSFGEDGYYTVQKGDTLFNIAKRANLTVEELKALNSIAADGIKIGQKLKVVK